MAAPESGTPRSWAQAAAPFAIGGLSGCVATCCIQPIDMVKVNMQMGAGKNPMTVAADLIRREGLLGMYKGLDAGLLRQVTYTTARMGLYRALAERAKRHDESTLPLWKKAAVGFTAGGAASLLGTPADLAMVRMQSDFGLPLAQRRNYTGVGNALARVVKEEGVTTLWRGSTPVVIRACALNMGMLATYDQVKETLEPRYGNGWTSKLVASAVSGWAAVTLSIPFDFIKTRLQGAKVDPTTGCLPYRGVVDCATKVCRSEGVGALFTGYLTYYVRLAPHAMITLLVSDALHSALRPSEGKHK